MFDAERPQRERVRRPRVREHDAQRRPSNPTTQPIQTEQGQQVEHDRGRVRRGEVVPGAAPPEDHPERHVGVVSDRAVGIALGVVLGPVAVERLAMQNLVGPDYAGIADVDHVRVDDVQADPEPDQEDHADRQPRDRHEQPERPARPPAAEPEQQHPHEQIQHERVDRRRGEPDLRVVEQRERDRQAEQREQVDVEQRPRTALATAAGQAPPAPRQERRDEQRAQRDPHVPGVDSAPERARIATGHRPRHLEARPDLGDARGGVVDVDLGELDLLLAGREPADLPLTRTLGVLVRDRVRVARQLRLDRQRRGGDLLDLGRGQPVALRRDVRLGHEHRRVRVRRRGRDGFRDGEPWAPHSRVAGIAPARTAATSTAITERRELRAQGRVYALKLQSFCPMNDSGVPAAIAIAWAATFIRPASTSTTNTT